MFQLRVIIASTRPGRKGKAVADWFVAESGQHPSFQIEVLDLAEINLPVFDEPEHPRFRKYTKQHTKDWSAQVDAADAFVIVTPEYNYSMPPALLNAMDYLSGEWKYKPVGFVSYGGISGGTRSVQMAKLLITTFNMMPIQEAVTIPLFEQYLDEAGTFTGNEKHQRSAKGMLDELAKWTAALKTMRP
jgi:NAD(P)H-dependent FMN reductase